MSTTHIFYQHTMLITQYMASEFTQLANFRCFCARSGGNAGITPFMLLSYFTLYLIEITLIFMGIYIAIALWSISCVMPYVLLSLVICNVLFVICYVLCVNLLLGVISNYITNNNNALAPYSIRVRHNAGIRQ